MPIATAAFPSAQLLPGTWRIGATNFPLWLRGDRQNPSFSYELKREHPLVLRDTVSWTTPEGERKNLVGTDRQRGNAFVWRGRGAFALLASRWSICGASADGTILGLRFSKSIATPAGVDIIVRQGTPAQALRATVSASSSLLGLENEEFASLTWLHLD
jgi:hypothetical protein